VEDLIKAMLNYIDDELRRLYWNKFQEEIDSPFQNTGNSYMNDTFYVRAYYWGDDEDKIRQPNFQYKKFKCYWYKHSMRGLEWEYKGERNCYISTDFLSKMLEDIIRSLRVDFCEIKE